MIKLFKKLFPSKSTRAYRKMHRRHKKELIKLAKEDAEWDWSYLHTLVITKIRHMHEYYKAGNNVWQTDETLLPTIDELKHVLDLQEELDNVFKDVPAPEMTVNDNKSLTFTWSEEARKLSDEAYKRHDELYEEIYSYIGKHLQGWWD